MLSQHLKALGSRLLCFLPDCPVRSFCIVCCFILLLLILYVFSHCLFVQPDRNMRLPNSDFKFWNPSNNIGELFPLRYPTLCSTLYFGSVLRCISVESSNTYGYGLRAPSPPPSRFLMVSAIPFCVSQYTVHLFVLLFFFSHKSAYFYFNWFGALF